MLMEATLSSTSTIPTFQKSERKTKTQLKKSEMGRAVHDSSTFRCSNRPETTSTTKRRKRTDMKDGESGGSEEEEEGDERGEVERKIVALQRLVPGGESLGVDKLFEETAGYILALQCQIKAMRVLTSFIEGLEKEKRKFGG